MIALLIAVLMVVLPLLHLAFSKVPKKTLDPGDIIRVGNTEAVFKRE